MIDKREKLPSNYTLVEYAEEILNRLPVSGLTYRESWAIKEYVKLLQKRLPAEELEQEL